MTFAKLRYRGTLALAFIAALGAASAAHAQAAW